MNSKEVIYTRKKIVNIILGNKTFLSACSKVNKVEWCMLKIMLWEYERDILNDNQQYTMKKLYRLYRKDLIDCVDIGYIKTK